MPNFASVLKSEILRLARKEVRAELDGFKKASARFRSDIAGLKKVIADQEKRLARLESGKAPRKARAVEVVKSTKPPALA